MRISYLLAETDKPWGGVKVALEAANALAARGHSVCVVSRTGPPAWMPLHCRFVQSPDLADVPSSDLVVATYWTTVPPAVRAGSGIPVHFCQGYEGEQAAMEKYRSAIEETYRLPIPKLTIADHLAELLRQRFAAEVYVVPNAIDPTTMFAGPPLPIATDRPVRVGLVGPYECRVKGIATGWQACQLAQRAGLPLEVVRITNTRPQPEEQSLPLACEWHVQVPPSEMGGIYRSLDVLIGCSDRAEGFYLPALEAMACGVPCVLTDVPCHRSYGEGQYALYVPLHDPQAMAEALVVAALHAPVRESLRAAGLAAAGRHHPEQWIARLEAAFSSIAGRYTRVA